MLCAVVKLVTVSHDPKIVSLYQLWWEGGGGAG